MRLRAGAHGKTACPLGCTLIHVPSPSDSAALTFLDANGYEWEGASDDFAAAILGLSDKSVSLKELAEQFRAACRKRWPLVLCDRGLFFALVPERKRELARNRRNG